MRKLITDYHAPPIWLGRGLKGTGDKKYEELGERDQCDEWGEKYQQMEQNGLTISEAHAVGGFVQVDGDWSIVGWIREARGA